MELIFTLHAMKRIEEREIMLRDVVQCLDTPDKIENRGGKTLFMKLNEDRTKLLICICSITAESCKIITVIDTSKISKYL